MKNWVELFSIFQKFYAEIQTRFNISIRVLRNDNAREYFSASFTSFMSQHGILYQSSCAHTPQQNGVVEHNNRHLVETTRTLLLHSNVPFRFWRDTVLTASYLINRMPSSILHDQISHSLLFPDQPLYFLPSRVFGCTCFVHILTPGQDKLSGQSHEVPLLGIFQTSEGLSLLFLWDSSLLSLRWCHLLWWLTILLHVWVSSCFWSLTPSHYLPTWCSAFSTTLGLSLPSSCRCFSFFGRGTCWLTSYPFGFSCPGSASFC